MRKWATQMKPRKRFIRSFGKEEAIDIPKPVRLMKRVFRSVSNRMKMILYSIFSLVPARSPRQCLN